jgi:hypothetical protein
MCPHSIYCVLSIPLVGGARATLQTAHLSSPLSKQCARAARCTVLIPYTRSFPLHTEATQISGVRANGDYTSMANSSSILPFVPRPMCQGSEPLYMSPLNYKRGGMQRYNTARKETHLDPAQAHKFIQALKLNTSHSGVGYYAPVARTTLHPCVFLCKHLRSLTSKTFKPPPHLRT